MDNKEVGSSESWTARNVNGSRQGGVGVGHEFGGNVELLAVRGVVLLLPAAVVRCFRNCRVALRPCGRQSNASQQPSLVHTKTIRG